MEMLWIVIGLVTVVTLYDHFSGRSWQSVTSNHRNEEVFRKGNKAYGAYAIRRDYDRTMAYILLTMMALISLFAIGRLFAAEAPVHAAIPNDHPSWDTTALILPEKDKVILPEKQQEKTTPKPEQRVAFVNPEIVDRDVPDELPIQEDLEGVKAGTHDAEGGEGDFDWGDPGPGGGDDPFSGAVEKIVHESWQLHEDPRFPGSLPEFVLPRIKYPEGALEMGIGGTCRLKFIINEDGAVSDIHVVQGVPDCSLCDKEAVRVLKLMPKWIPGKINGRGVKVYMLLPINFTPMR